MLAQKPDIRQLSQFGQFQLHPLTAFEKLEQSCIIKLDKDNFVVDMENVFHGKCVSE